MLVIVLTPSAFAKEAEVLEFTSEDYDRIDPNLSQVPARLTEQDNVSANMTKVLDAPNQEELRYVKIQVLLDRAGFSPGAINGKRSDYLDRLSKLYAAKADVDLLSMPVDKIDALLLKTGGEVFETYELTSKDVAGPFTTYIPSRIQDQAGLEKLNFKSGRESIAERFHMDELFLARMNLDVDFTKIGSKVTVTNIGRYLDKWVGKIHADKTLKQVTAFDQNGDVLAVYPASIGSQETPSPKGSFTVRNKAGFPAYTLAAENGFEKLDDKRQVLIAPGPNNPVGSAWIGLSKKTYGIHGTPEPSNIGRAESHGCIRLTNWDALELARLVRTGIEVVID
ncbi:MAG: L,D-transpeptidase [Salaquimonas sp.]